MKYSFLLFLFLCEFSFGQIPGNPRIISPRDFPTVYTLSCTPTGDLSSADVIGQIINTGRYPVTVSGILWGTGLPTIESNLGKTTDGNILGQPFTSNITPLPEEGTVYIVAYATTAAGTFYGKALVIPQQKVVSPFTGKTWMAYNLGASALPKVPQTRGDTASYGHLYQWGRRSDGHQIILPLASPTFDVSGVATAGNAFSGTFTVTSTTQASSYTNTTSSFYGNATDWLKSTVSATIRNSLWQGINGLNNPCPTGFRVPTFTEFKNETDNFSPYNNAGAFNSFLMIPTSGSRQNVGTLLSPYFSYDRAAFWTSTIFDDDQSYTVTMSSSTVGQGTPQRAYAYSVRCIKGETSSGATAIISGYTVTSSTGDLTAGVPVTGVTQTITANVQTIGTYDISTKTVNGVRFVGKGAFTGSSGLKPIVLTATGTPLVGTPPATFNTFAGNTSPTFSFTRTVSGASTNGTAEVDSYTPISSTGQMLKGTPITGGVSQTISANVTIPGAYNITAINNGVTYNARGIFESPGPQNIELTASGTPIESGVFSFTLNTTPNANFSSTINEPSTNGTAVVTFFQPETNANRMNYLTTYSGTNFSQNMKATVSKVGTYNFTTNTENGVTFTGSGTFGSTSTTPTQGFTLYASGKPLDGSIDGTNYLLNTNIIHDPFKIYTEGEPSTNGTAIVSSYNSISSSGNIYKGLVPSGVSQTISADVTRVGTYHLKSTNHPVQFVGKGTFTTTGLQNIVLTVAGTGTETISTTNTNFDLNTNPVFSFNRPVLEPSTNGMGVVTSYTNNSGEGVIFAGVPVSGVTQTIIANVTTSGSYSITTNTANGVTFVGNNTLGGTATSSIVLTATGTPTSISSFDNFTLNTIPSLTFSRTTVDASTNGGSIVSNYTIGSATGQMTAAIPVSGVTQAIIANVTTAGNYNITTNTVNGVRFASSGTFTNEGFADIILTATGTPTSTGMNTFTLNTTPNVSFTANMNAHPSTNGSSSVTSYEDRYFATNGTTGTLRVGAEANGVTNTIRAIVAATGTYNISTNTVNGVTFTVSGIHTAVGGNKDFQLTATGTPISTGTYTYTLNTNPTVTFERTTYLNTSSNGSANITGYTLSSSTGETYRGWPVSNVTQTVTANVTTPGTYNITIPSTNGVSFASVSGTFTEVGNHDITFTAIGTPTASGTHTFTSNTNPQFRFSRFTAGEASSNGSAIISSFTISDETGSLHTEVPATNVKQTIIADVTKAGFYHFKTIDDPYDNDVFWTASGTFTTTGLQPIELIAKGTPKTVVTPPNYMTYKLNATPQFTFLKNATWQSSNGSSLFTNFVSQSTIGEMFLGFPVSGVSQRLKGDATNGNFKINTNTVNGVTFSLTGSTGGGNNTILDLVASGTPIASGTFSYTTNTTPSIIFSTITAIPNPSTNGSAIFSSYNLISTSGQLQKGVSVTGNNSIYHTYTVNVTQIGSYNISMTANGVTFSAKGTFTQGQTGNRNIILYATGTPINAGSDNFILNVSGATGINTITRTTIN